MQLDNKLKPVFAKFGSKSYPRRNYALVRALLRSMPFISGDDGTDRDAVRIERMAKAMRCVHAQLQFVYFDAEYWTEHVKLSTQYTYDARDFGNSAGYGLYYRLEPYLHVSHALLNDSSHFSDAINSAFEVKFEREYSVGFIGNLETDLDDPHTTEILTDRSSVALWLEPSPLTIVQKELEVWTSIAEETPLIRYWLEWYQGFLDGEPLDWELQRRVALIGDVIWNAGPVTVAEEIEKIRAKLALEKRIEELEADLRKAKINLRGIGDNRPPEMIDDVPVAQELVVVWQPLQDLKYEIAKDDPDPGNLQQIVNALITILKKGFDWCLKKSDLIVDTAIRWAIPAGGTGYIALNPEKLEAVIKALKILLAAI